MAKIFPIDFEEKNSIACGDFVLFSDSEDGDKIKKAQYSNLKGEKGDTGTAATVSVGGTTTGAAGTSACVTNCGTTSAAVLCFTIPKGDKGDTGQTGPAIVNADWNGDDIDFTEEDGNVVTLSCAKVCLKGDKGDTGCTGPTGPSICAAAFNGNNIDFTETNGCVVTLTDAKTCLKGDTGATGAAATVSVGTTTTLDAGCCATVSNSGTSSAAVFNFGIPKGDKGDTGATGCTGPAGNGIACVTSTKAGKVTTVDITCTNGCSYCFQVSDGEDGQGSGDMLKCVYDPNNCNADAFDYCNFSNTPDLSCYQTKACMVCDLTGADNTHYPSAKAVSDAITASGGGDMLKSVYDPNNCSTDAFNYNNMYNKLTAGSGINITANAISTASNFGTSSTAAATVQKEVSIPGITTLATGQVVHILPSATSTVANSTLKVNNFDAYPMRYNGAAITTSTDSIVRPAKIVTTFVFDGTYWQFMGHGLDSNTTYSSMSVAEATTGTCASGRSIAACTLKCAIQTHAPISNNAYGSGWCGSNSAPTQNAVYAKVSTIDELIPSEATCSNQLADKNYVNDGINSVTAYYITKNAASDQFATYAELAAATTFYSGGVVRVPTRNDYTIVLDDETHSHELTRYIYNSGWEYQYSINESPMIQAQLDALNSGITAAKVCAYDAIPTITDNCQIANGCGYTTCTGTISTCSQIISTLGYTPYNSTNPSGYTTCTGTITGICMNGCSCGTSGVVDLGTITPGITKIFTLSSTSDLTTATEAYTWYKSGGNPIINISGDTKYYYLSNVSSTGYLTFISLNTLGPQTATDQWRGFRLAMNASNGTSVTSILTAENYITIKSTAPASGTSVGTITLVI